MKDNAQILSDVADVVQCHLNSYAGIKIITTKRHDGWAIEMFSHRSADTRRYLVLAECCGSIGEALERAVGLLPSTARELYDRLYPDDAAGNGFRGDFTSDFEIDYEAAMGVCNYQI